MPVETPVFPSLCQPECFSRWISEAFFPSINSVPTRISFKYPYIALPDLLFLWRLDCGIYCHQPLSWCEFRCGIKLLFRKEGVFLESVRAYTICVMNVVCMYRWVYLMTTRKKIGIYSSLRDSRTQSIIFFIYKYFFF